MLQNSVKLLKRVTSSGKFIPYIDGLRFFAIMAVVLSHFNTYYNDRVGELPEMVRPVINFLFGDSYSGVMLFFGISGFILGMPFVKQYAYDGNKIKLKRYFLRRLTRLEPPYIVVLTMLFVLNIFMADKGGFVTLFPHYIASLFYCHNIIYGGFPTLNPVFWSLEVEVQFYILAPIFALVFKLNKLPRRLILLCVIFSWKFIFLRYNPFDFISLYDYVHYFLAGFLAADLFLEYSKNIKPKPVFDLICIVATILMWNGVKHYGLDLLYIILILTLTASSIYYKKFLSIPLVYIIGGMCYTIYMLHQRIMYVFLDKINNGTLFLDNLYMDFFVRLFFILTIIGVLCSIFFIFIERSTMKKEWWKYKSLKKLFFT